MRAAALLAALLAAPAAAQATVPFEIKAGLVVVRARVDKWDRTMVLDTGSAYTIIAGVGLSGKERPRDTPGGMLVKGRTRTATVQLGGLPPVRMTVLETNLDDPRFEGIGGIIGEDLLSRFGSVKIDYIGRTVRVRAEGGESE